MGKYFGGSEIFTGRSFENLSKEQIEAPKASFNALVRELSQYQIGRGNCTVPMLALDVQFELAKPDSPFKKMLIAALNNFILQEKFKEQLSNEIIRKEIRREALRHAFLKEEVSLPILGEVIKSQQDTLSADLNDFNQYKPLERGSLLEALNKQIIAFEGLKQQKINEEVIPEMIMALQQEFVEVIFDQKHKDALSERLKDLPEEKKELGEIVRLMAEAEHKTSPKKQHEIEETLFKEFIKTQELKPEKAQSAEETLLAVRRRITLNAEIAMLTGFKKAMELKDRVLDQSLNGEHQSHTKTAGNIVRAKFELKLAEKKLHAIDSNIEELKKVKDELSTQTNEPVPLVRANGVEPQQKTESVSDLLVKKCKFLLNLANAQMEKHFEKAEEGKEDMLSSCMSLMHCLYALQRGDYCLEDNKLLNAKTTEDLTETFTDALAMAKKGIANLPEELTDAFFVTKLMNEPFVKQLQEHLNSGPSPNFFQ